jgi:hypothetical protein
MTEVIQPSTYPGYAGGDIALGDVPDNDSVMSFNGGSYHDDRSVISDMNVNNNPYTGTARNGKTTGYNGKVISQTYGTNAYGNGLTVGSTDKGHYCTSRSIKGRSVQIEFYMSRHNVGSLIRNAVTGFKENNLRMGRIDEDAFFKVKLANGEFGQDCPGSLFYNSPEEYERHFYTTVSQSIKDKWMARNLEYQRICENKYAHEDHADEVVMIH